MYQLFLNQDCLYQASFFAIIYLTIKFMTFEKLCLYMTCAKRPSFDFLEIILYRNEFKG